jgi:hypothetical protein
LGLTRPVILMSEVRRKEGSALAGPRNNWRVRTHCRSRDPNDQ